MRTYKALLFTLAAALFAFAVSGCRTGDQYRAAFQSTTLTYGTYDGRMNSTKQGDRFFSEDGSFLAVGMQPFAWHQMAMQAELSARAMVEAQYAARPVPTTNSPETSSTVTPCEGKPE